MYRYLLLLLVAVSSYATQNYPAGSVKAIVTDIEGTTTAIAFVQNILFPYAKKHIGDYVRSHQGDRDVIQAIAEVKQISATPFATVEHVITTLQTWIDQDKKATPLKSLQGLIWENGYVQGDYTGHVYEDAYDSLRAWDQRHFPIYIYSSGSVQAQKLLFSHSDFGDMTPHFKGYFDTKTGGKKEAASYTAIAQTIGQEPQEILFLSDSIDELKAAKQAGMQVLMLCRDGLLPSPDYDSVTSFTEITLQ